MSTDFFIRLLGMVVLSILGVIWGAALGKVANSTPGPNTFSVEQYAFTIGLVGALAGLILTPMLTTRPIRAIKTKLGRISAQSLLAGLMGLVVGLLIATLLAFPSRLPNWLGDVLPFAGVVIFSYLGIAVFVMRQYDLFSVIQSIMSKSTPMIESSLAGSKNDSRTILLDTSVIIDGRIADIARTGFSARDTADPAVCAE